MEMNTKEDLLNVDLNSQKVALYIGSEENGLSMEIQNKLDLIVKINHDELSKFFNSFQINYENLDQAMEEFLAKREKLRNDKDFNQADVMRDKLKEIGLLIKDGDDSAWYWENS